MLSPSVDPIWPGVHEPSSVHLAWRRIPRMPNIQVAQMTDFGLTLTEQLQATVFNTDPDWACGGCAERTGVHGLIQYPAMMVPRMQRDILLAMRTVDPSITSILDPFVGSGTALTESLRLGCNFIGIDINPLAVLISRVKSAYFDVDSIRKASLQINIEIARDGARNYEVKFNNLEKWFLRSNIIQLSKIRRAIQSIDDLYIRRFFWVALAETIRKCSNSRTSTYKLHVRPAEQVQLLDSVALDIFNKVVTRSLNLFDDEEHLLSEKCLLTNSQYNKQVAIRLGDIRNFRSTTSDQVDLVITSPPYGDNKTTVPYGQFSYLALQWIPHEDIDPTISPDIVNTTSTIDSKSLGGDLKTSRHQIEYLCEVSRNFRDTYDFISAKTDINNKNALSRLSAFCYDLFIATASIAYHVRPGGYLVWTIGERTIGGVNLPLARILDDFHSFYDSTSIRQYPRRIYTKRMPTKNLHTDLMLFEQVCIYRTQTNVTTAVS